MESRTFVNLGHSDYLVNSIHKLYESTSLCDVTLRTQDGDNIKAHWLILVAHSEYFECLYTSRDDQSDIVCLDTDSNTLRKVLEYLYTGKITFTEECRKQLVDTGQLFKLPSLVNLCSKKQTTSCYKSISQSSQSKQENDGSHSVFVPESQTCESDEFDANRVKEELEEEDSELHVTFTSEMCNQAERRVQSESDLLKEGPEQVKIMHIVQNVAVQKDKQTLGQKSSEPSEAFSTEEAMEDSDFPGFSDPNIEFIGVREKRKRKSASKAAKPKRKTHSEFAAKILIVRNESDQQEEKESSDLSMTGKDEESGSVEGYVISRRCEQNEDSNSNSLPDSDDAKESSSHLSPSARKKPRKISKPVKIRAGNFLEPPKVLEVLTSAPLDKDTGDLGIADIASTVSSLISEEGKTKEVPKTSISEPELSSTVVSEPLASSSNDGASTSTSSSEGNMESSETVQGRKSGVCKIRYVEPGPGLVECTTCHRWLKKSSMSSHIRRHNKDFHFHCDQCGESFFTSSFLKEHVAKVHHGTGVCKCKICGKVMATYRGMKEHIQLHSQEKHECEQCDKVFGSSLLLKRHTKCHAVRFHCDHCQKTFATKGELKTHAVLHMDNPQMFKCSQCSYESRWRASVRRHVEVVHTTERPHVCGICGVGFKEKSNLLRHLKTVTCAKKSAVNSMWEDL